MGDNKLQQQELQGGPQFVPPPPLREGGTEGGKKKTMEFPRSQKEEEKCQGRRKNKRLDMRGIFFP